MIYTRWRHLLEDLNQPWLAPRNLEKFGAAIHEKGAALSQTVGDL